MLLQNADEGLAPAQRRDLDRIHAIGQHLDRLVLDVLELGRSQLDQLRIDLKPLHIGDLLQEVALVGEQMATDKGLAWRLQAPPVLPPVLGDPGRLRQVLFNLIGNAVKFTVHGEVALLVSTNASEVLFAVSDTGLGIPTHDQALIFDEYRQSERTAARGYGGMGLGLAITRRLVELHGGRIELQSSGDEGGGATFSFTLPIAQDAFMGLNVLTKPLSPTSITHVLQQHGLMDEAGVAAPTILIVDDEPQMLRLHSQMVRRHLPQFDVVEASSGRQALERMRQEAPDLVLLDLMMPELDGFAVLAAMQAHVSLRSVPVIIMTAQVLHEDELLRLNRCVAGVLGKGIFSGDETAQQIDRALRNSKRVGAEPQRIARRTMAFIHEHYAERISRGHMARHIGVNERYLTHCFHQSVGVAPMEYLNRYRVNVAKGLLESEHKSIGDIALDTGFASSSQFSRVFRQHTGMSPTQYAHSRNR
jgi:AraC-like DNA-binding protein